MVLQRFLCCLSEIDVSSARDLFLGSGGAKIADAKNDEQRRSLVQHY